MMIAIAVLVFGAIYEAFSFGVYSPYMIYAFCWFLVLGVLPFLRMHNGFGRLVEHEKASFCYHFGLATVTVGSLLKGILEIYGTTNRLMGIYWVVGGVFVAAGLFLGLRPQPEKKMNNVG